MNLCRKRDREKSYHIHAQGDPMYGRSVYDNLEFCLAPKGEPEDNYVVIRKQDLSAIVIEEL